MALAVIAKPQEHRVTATMVNNSEYTLGFVVDGVERCEAEAHGRCQVVVKEGTHVMVASFHGKELEGTRQTASKLKDFEYVVGRKAQQ